MKIGASMANSMADVAAPSFRKRVKLERLNKELCMVAGCIGDLLEG
jgi:hypothetical protein